MKISYTLRSIISGIILASLITAVVSGVFFGIESLNQNSSNISHSPFDWDFDSPLKLANQMYERSIYLYGITITVGRITDVREYGYSGEAVAYFNYSLSGFDVFFIIESENWKFESRAAGVSSEFPSSVYLDNVSTFTPLHQGLQSDVKQFENMTSTVGGWQTISSVISINASYFEIMHIYQDGSLIWLYAFNNTVVVQYDRITEYRNEPHIGWKRDSNFETLWFVGDTEYQFPNYTNAVNLFLDVILEIVNMG